MHFPALTRTLCTVPLAHSSISCCCISVLLQVVSVSTYSTVIPAPWPTVATNSIGCIALANPACSSRSCVDLAQ
ncbi:hypothetical protein B0H21DRAFT_139409 [Amylocystis lapponica]|nr:hypothetical protein B0H21DRAFT_139409 [Amylocystis lapponica]